MKININLGGSLFLIFLILKLTGVISWSWIWVLSPIWIPLIIAVLAGIFILSVKARLK